MWSRILRGRRPAEPVRVVLYTREGCHLCEVVKAEIGRARTRTAFALEEVDVDLDPELARRYGLSVPVLEIAGRVAFKGRLTADAFAQKLERRASEAAAPEDGSR